MNASKQQIIAINTALHKKGLMHRKAEIIAGVTEGRTSSSGKLYFNEAQLLLASFNQPTVSDEHGKRMRNNIIAMAHELNWITPSNQVQPGGSIKVVNDYTRLDNWMLKSSYLKKKLFDYTYNELPKLVTQFKNVYLSYIKK